MTRLTQSVALACGAAGAFVDVSSYANLLEGASRSWGRQSEFEDAAPGTFSFTLDNSDGRFNPGSTTLATPVTEGMEVCWQLGSRLTAGTILAIEPSFPEAESAWAQVTVTCDDMLGNAARVAFAALDDALFGAAGGVAQWLFDDTVGSAVAAETVVGRANLKIQTTPVTFGATNPRLAAAAVVSIGAGGKLDTVEPLTPWLAPSTWNFWVVQTGGGTFFITPSFKGVTNGLLFEVFIAGAGGNITLGHSGGPTITGPAILEDVAYYVSVTSSATVGPYTFRYELRVDGVSYGVQTYTALGNAEPGSRWLVQAGNSGTGAVYLSRLTYAVDPIDETAVAEATPAERLAALAAAAPEVTLDTLPTLSTPILGEQADQAIFDAMNEVIRAEQGAIYTATTGTLTAPVEKIKVRARDRVAAVTYSFNVETEASGGTDFIRDITNMVRTVTADGPVTSATYIDTTLEARVGSKNTTETVPFRDFIDLYTWATDRSFRGANVALRAASLTIDALTTPTDRTANLLALVPGDRIQVTGLPSSLGFTTWDGWLLGADEHHSLTEHTFTLYLQPVLPDPIILDTDYLTAGGNLSLNGSITNSATSISVESSDGTLFTTGADLPEKIRVESECMTVTAVSGASSPQTFTVTRGVTDPVTGLATTAAAHADAVTLELADYGVLAY